MTSSDSHAHSGHEHTHEHAIATDADRRYLWAALVLLLAYMAGEIVVAWWSGSLALLSDAGHMLSDAGAIAVALWAMSLAARPAQGPWTYGLKRAEILAALANGVVLLVLAVVLGVEAVTRLITPPPVAGWPVVATAAVGVVVNVAATALLARANRSSLNVEGAYQHILTDLFGFLGTLAAGVVIWLTGWARADAIATLLVVALMLRAGWGLVRQAGAILLEGAPPGVDLDAIRTHILGVPHVVAVHDLHVWTLTSALPALSAHVVVEDQCFRDGHCHELLDQVQRCLQGHFDVEHSTFQFEPVGHAAHEGSWH